MKIENALSPEMLQVFETIPDLYFVLSHDFRVLTASERFLKASLKELENIKGKTIFEIFPENPGMPKSYAATNLHQSLIWVIKNKRPYQLPLQRFDVSSESKPGVFEERYWRISNTPILDEEGNIKYIINKVNDITEEFMARKRVENGDEELEQLLLEQVITKEDLLFAHAEANLEREKLYNILMQAPALICIFEGPDHVFKLVNPDYQRAVGDRPILGKPIAEAMPELKEQSIFELLDQVYNTGESYYAFEMKVQLDHKNSGELSHNYYNFTYQAIRDLNGEVEGILVFAYEVTIQVEARQKVEQREQALQELNEKLINTNEKLFNTQQELQSLNSELEERVTERTSELELAKAKIENERNRLKRFFMQAPSAICLLDGPDLVFELVNPVYEGLFPGRNLLGKPLFKAMPEIADQSIAKILSNVYQTGETFKGKEVLISMARWDSGPLEDFYFNFIYQPRFNEEGKVDGIQVFANDVTIQVKARQSVEQIAQRLQLITDSMPAAISYIDIQERYLFANHLSQKWRGGAIVGKNMLDVMGPITYYSVKPYIDQALKGERVRFHREATYTDGKRHVQCEFVPHREEGKVKGFYALIVDVSEQMEARLKIESREKEAKALADELANTNVELKNANEQLTRINVDLDNFIYTASHDLKAPILNIEGLMHILERWLVNEGLVSKKIEHVINLMADSVERFKRTIANLTEVVKLQKEHNQGITPLALADVIQNVLLDLEPILQETGAKLELHVDKCDLVYFSEKNLRSVVYNLLSNALKYRSQKRSVIIKIRCEQEDGYTLFSVEDNGMGMDLSDESKVFGMFSRLHDHVEGSGIGLYMVRKMVENAGGKIIVKSKLDEGSIFKVYFKNK